MAGTTLLSCVDCGAEFEFTEREAVFYQGKGWNPPRRCKTCRVKRHPESKNRHADDNKDSEQEAALAANLPEVKYKVNCATCGIETLVKFKKPSMRTKTRGRKPSCPRTPRNSRVRNWLKCWRWRRTTADFL